MLRKVNYTTEEERDILVEQAKVNGEHIIEDAILLNEKYLIFDTKPTEPTPQHTPEPTLAELQAQQLAQAEAIAAIFERLEGGV